MHLICTYMYVSKLVSNMRDVSKERVCIGFEY